MSEHKWASASTSEDSEEQVPSKAVLTATVVASTLLRAGADCAAGRITREQQHDLAVAVIHAYRLTIIHEEIGFWRAEIKRDGTSLLAAKLARAQRAALEELIRSIDRARLLSMMLSSDSTSALAGAQGGNCERT